MHSLYVHVFVADYYKVYQSFMSVLKLVLLFLVSVKCLLLTNTPGAGGNWTVYE